MTRGKVLENRTDLELEARGTIFQGRDEKAIMMQKKQEDQNAIKEALQRQIEEKNKRKEDEKAKEKELQAKEEARMKVEVPYEPSVFKKKITMHN
jgi:protein involved in temperature-dependent protein secretion